MAHCSVDMRQGRDQRGAESRTGLLFRKKKRLEVEVEEFTERLCPRGKVDPRRGTEEIKGVGTNTDLHLSPHRTLPSKTLPP